MTTSCSKQGFDKFEEKVDNELRKEDTSSSKVVETKKRKSDRKKKKSEPASSSKVVETKKRKFNRKHKRKKKDSALKMEVTEEIVDDPPEKTHLPNEVKVGRRNTERDEYAKRNDGRSEKRKGVLNDFEILKKEKKDIIINSKILTFQKKNAPGDTFEIKDSPRDFEDLINKKEFVLNSKAKEKKEVPTFRKEEIPWSISWSEDLKIEKRTVIKNLKINKEETGLTFRNENLPWDDPCIENLVNEKEFIANSSKRKRIMLTCRNESFPWWKSNLQRLQTRRESFPTGGGPAMDWSGTLEGRSRTRCPYWWRDTPCLPTHIVILIWTLLMRTKWVLKAAFRLLPYQSNRVSQSDNTYLENMEVGSNSQTENFSEEVEIERPVHEASEIDEMSKMQRIIKELEAKKDNDSGKKLNYNYEIRRTCLLYTSDAADE